MDEPTTTEPTPVDAPAPPTRWQRAGRYLKYAGIGALVLVVLLMLYWSDEPNRFDVLAVTAELTGIEGGRVPGTVTTATLIHTIETLLEKRGGYLSNDRLPPGVLLDNIPNWEWGVLRMARDLTDSLRNDMSRSQTQSAEDADLMVAEPKLNIDSESWFFPSAEGEYRDGVNSLKRYLDRLVREDRPDAQFFTRADNLRDWLALAEKRLGDLSQRLSASVGQQRVNTDLRGDAAAEQSTPTPVEQRVKTPWFEIDNVFYEARGSCWALLHYFKAIEADFAGVLEDKNALVSVRQIVRELEGTQGFIWSPVILNGTGFGFVANHSLVMASYISRANAAVIDLRNLLEQG